MLVTCDHMSPHVVAQMVENWASKQMHWKLDKNMPNTKQVNAKWLKIMFQIYAFHNWPHVNFLWCV